MLYNSATSAAQQLHLSLQEMLDINDLATDLDAKINIHNQEVERLQAVPRVHGDCRQADEAASRLMSLKGQLVNLQADLAAAVDTVKTDLANLIAALPA